jgi:hypothetical protein
MPNDAGERRDERARGRGELDCGECGRAGLKLHATLQ